MPYVSINKFGCEVLTEEPVLMFSGVIRHMLTIESFGSCEHKLAASLCSSTLINTAGKNKQKEKLI
jgi:hypothetical protein